MTVATQTAARFKGTDRLLYGIIFGVLAFWLFAQTTLNIAPTMAEDLRIKTSVMNIAVSITALFSGIFIVVIGGLADRVGRVKIVHWGFFLSIVGSLLVGLAPAGALASTFLMLGRICQGLSGAFIMPASLALVKAYWDGAERQRAISLWSIGSWGGSGFAALFGGLINENVGWRWIFFGSAGISLIGMLMVRGTPESRAEAETGYKFDTQGVLTFMVTMVALQVLATQGSHLGWSSLATLGLLAISVVFGIIFFRTESGNSNAFVDFKLFKNMTYTGATLSNLLLNGRRGHSHCVDDVTAGRRQYDRATGRASDTGICHRHCCLHSRRREIIAVFRAAQTDDLGFADCWNFDSAIDANSGHDGNL